MKQIKTVGIIAEYNPFHNGHLYQIEKIRNETHAENIVVIMSGDFVERGTPAFTDKKLRTRMALECGADFVFLLPVTSSTASAQNFALGGITLLNSLGFVDGVCFGCENNALNLLNKISTFFLNEPETFSLKISEYLNQGLSFPLARQKTLKEFLPEIFENDDTILSNPNNILAIEYLRALKQTGSSIIPFPIKRCDNGYNSLDSKNNFLSATGIREKLNNNTEPTSLSKFIPKKVINILAENKNHFPMNENDFSNVLYMRLSIMSEKDKSISDMTEELYNKINNELLNFKNISDFAGSLKTKQYTYSRISRVLCHLLLNISKEDILPPYYARLLGFKRDKSYLLKNVHDIPLITKTADYKTILSDFYDLDIREKAIKQFEKDLFASHLYRYIQNTKYNNDTEDEFRSNIEIL